MTLINLAETPDDIHFCIRLDDDDEATARAVDGLQDHSNNIQVIAGGRPAGMGKEYNRLAALVPDATAFCLMNDSVFLAPIVIGRDGMPSFSFWDSAIAASIARHGNDQVFSWFMSGVPRGMGFDLPIFTARWVAAAGRLFPEWFPFWFIDMWAFSIAFMVHDSPPLVLRNLLCFAPHGVSQRCRDVEFWCRVYEATHRERLDEAARIRANLGKPTEISAAALYRVRMAEQGNIDNLMRLAATLGDPAPPDAAYIAARARAAELV
jgi:hypothetical protein